MSTSETPKRKDQAPDPRTLPPVDPPPTRDDGREDGASSPVRRLGRTLVEIVNGSPLETSSANPGRWLESWIPA